MDPLAEENHGGGGDAEERALGALVGRCSGDTKAAGRTDAVGGVFWAVVPVGLLGAGLIAGAPVLTLIGALGTGLVLLFALRGRGSAGRGSAGREAAQQFSVHELGVVHTVGERAEVARWGDVNEVTVFSLAGPVPMHGCYLTRGDGHRIVLSTQRLRGLAELLPRIEEEVARAQLPAAMASVDAGGTVVFGDLRLDAAGLAVGGRTLPWDEVGRVTVENGKLGVHRLVGGRWYQRELMRFPNLELFRVLADRQTPVR
ncbi:hypothetical protein KNE206_57720 [Kitasatospora sp. NE20-6]|uniref:DUF6585 family protein n=1 Tax=Kitasatospora sp. NE20-6 TaxID=2859066 RepID=UPI0034DC19EA